MKIRLCLFMLLLLLFAPTYGQKRKTVRQPQPTPEEIARQEKVERMQANTERVMFIDSIVINKKHFLRAFHMSPEAGRIKQAKDIQRNEPDSISCLAYLNELGNKCYFSRQQTDSTSMLYSSYHEHNQWTAPALLQGINDDQRFSFVNYPFMMADGQTLYFAAIGDEGLGGYDIYMTTYDEENDRFLHPVNIGMPFNSESNDYLYAIDEYNNLGWFVTDRRQPQDTVCVYVFLPTTERLTYNPDEFTPEQIASFAQITSIHDTWYDPLQQQEAMQRLHKRSTNSLQVANPGKSFVINDALTYHAASDFRYPDGARHYQQWLSLLARHDELSLNLDKAREYYSSATPQERQQLSREIRNDEQEKEQLNQQIRDMEKSIRNAENTFLTINK